MDRIAIAWLWENWPSLIVAGIVSAAYVRLCFFNKRNAKNEGRIVRLMQVVSEMNPGQAGYLYNDNDNGKEKK